MNISEQDFEATIESVLLEPQRDYRKRTPEDYNRALCLDVGMLRQFLYATQPQEWEELKAQHGAETEDKFLKRLVSEIESRGTLDVLRRGVKAWGCKFDLAYFQPVSGLNEEHQKLYAGNVFSVIRQLHFSDKDAKALDLTLFLNGLPIITAELKNPLTAQTVQEAIKQYRHDRDPREPLFKFGRCLAHFAVDPDLVYMTTHLRGKDTEFLPFNKGNNNGAGNPPNPNGFKTAYLWEEVWQRDNLLDIIANFLQLVDVLDDDGKPTGKKALIFPRYHQLDTTRRLVHHAKIHGAGQHYLIQHSAGSGKSNTIAWLCHQLAGLHDAHDQRVFDSIVVITDRRGLDWQLQRNIKQFEQTRGVVENIDRTSKQLKKALEEGKNIIVTTLQKFPVIVEDITTLTQQRFAVVIDEAHSSQSGESTKSLKQVLSAASLEDAEKEDVIETDLEDEIVAEMKARGRLPHVSFFAFTATPKQKTLELFGTQQSDGSFLPFSLYTMRQAIEEGFILDVLENYTTYHEYWSLLKTIEDDPKYDREKATYLLKSFVSLHEHAIREKTEIMVEHFWNHVRPRIGGKAKAMVVTRSRLHAVRYKLAFDKCIKERGYKFKTLVAFSGTVKDPDTGLEYTEPQMNSTPDKRITEAQTAETFKQDEYRIIICANKFQTGFNEPFLHTMYVDKKLGGVNAVQTLSRLNRTQAGKDETMVLDFANDAEEIQTSFQPYYETTRLTEATDPNKLYDLQRQLEEFGFYTEADVDAFAQVYWNPKAKQEQLHALLDPIVDKFIAAAEEERADFKGKLTDYVRLYAFLSQVITFTDPSLEKLYVFARLLLRKLPVTHDELPKAITQNVNMDSYRIQQTSAGEIPLTSEEGKLDPMTGIGTGRPTHPQFDPLSQIIEDLNERFGTDFTEADKVFFAELERRLTDDASLVKSVEINSKDNVRLTFDHLFSDKLEDMIDRNFEIYRRVTDDAEFGEFIKTKIFELVYQRLVQSKQLATAT